MNLWDTWHRLIDGLRGGITALMDRLAGLDDPERRPAAFSIALVALSAKMSRADGIVTADEVAAFRRVVEIPPGEEDNVQRLFDLAKRDVAGFEAYAGRINRLAGGDALFLADVLDGLFHIAVADGYVHEAEMDYLARVAELFGLDQAAFDRLASRFVRVDGGDPYEVLGISPAADDAAVKAHWRKLVIENHPDRILAHGLPPEAMRLATDRLAAINDAWAKIRAERGI
ncbi:MAG: DnaJ family molecular chaperone [Hyphomicrobiaceae bacterium]|nr:DnaJ family molecular chaperone [Hyphomicrobiaceae bacterium]